VFHCRVTQVSLVCKTWQKVEREYPHRPVQLYMKPEDINSALLTWHLRDTSRLEEVKVLYDRDDILISEGYWKGIMQLLNHLSDKAPALCNLELVQP